MAILWHGQHRIPADPDKTPALLGAVEAAELPNPFRIATLNIHAGKGDDDRRDLDRTAALLDGGYDLIALQEIRGDLLGLRDTQVRTLGATLGMGSVFAPAERRWWHDHYGIGLLTRVELRGVRQMALPATLREKYRNAILVRVACQGMIVNVIATHLDTNTNRPLQLRMLADLFLSLQEPVIFIGDLNTPFHDPILQELLGTPGVVDAGAAGRLPDDNPVDWMLVRGLRSLQGVYVDNDATDHPLLWAELELIEAPGAGDDS